MNCIDPIRGQAKSLMFLLLVSISSHMHRNIKAVSPPRTRASQSPFSPRQEQALPYDEEQLLFLASSQVAADFAPLAPLMTQVALCLPLLPSPLPRSQLLIISSHCRVFVGAEVLAGDVLSARLSASPRWHFLPTHLRGGKKQVEQVIGW